MHLILQASNPLKSFEPSVWLMGLAGAILVGLFWKYLGGFRDAQRESGARIEKSLAEMRVSIERKVDKVEAKVDTINGRVGANSVAIGVLSRQVDNNQADIKSLFRSDEEIRKEIRK